MRLDTRAAQAPEGWPSRDSYGVVCLLIRRRSAERVLGGKSRSLASMRASVCVSFLLFSKSGCAITAAFGVARDYSFNVGLVVDLAEAVGALSGGAGSAVLLRLAFVMGVRIRDPAH